MESQEAAGGPPKRILARWSALLLAAGISGTIMMVLAPFFWLFEMASHFIVFYGIMAAAGGAGLLAAGRWRWFLAAIPSVAYAIAIAAPWYVPQAYAAPVGIPFRVMHCNVLVLNSNYDRLIELVRKKEPDFFIAQEMTQAWYRELQALRKDYPYVAGPEEGSHHVAIFSSVPFVRKQAGEGITSSMRDVQVEVELRGQPLSIVALHADPPFSYGRLQVRNRQLAQIGERVAHSDTPTVVAGDLNITMFSPVYDAFTQAGGLTNARQGKGVWGTWPAPLGLVTIPLDHVLHTAEIHCRDFVAGPFVGSDHYPVIADLVLSADQETDSAVPESS